jgi:hypothetical protein
MTVRVVLPRPVLAGGTIAAGQAVTGTSSFTAAVGASSQQVTFTGTKPRGIALNSAVNGAAVDVCCFGECDALAGDTIADGDILVCEYESGRLIPFADSAYTDGTVGWTVGMALEAAVDGQMFRVLVNIQSRAIATAPA